MKFILVQELYIKSMLYAYNYSIKSLKKSEVIRGLRNLQRYSGHFVMSISEVMSGFFYKSTWTSVEIGYLVFKPKLSLAICFLILWFRSNQTFLCICSAWQYEYNLSLSVVKTETKAN